MVVNKLVKSQVKSVFSMEVDIAKELLVQDLSRIRPVNPRLLNKLYALSNLGLQERYIGKYSKTRSIQQLAFRTWASEEDLLDWIHLVENSTSAYYKSNAGPSEGIIIKELTKEECTTVVAKKLRETGWGEALGWS